MLWVIYILLIVSLLHGLTQESSALANAKNNISMYPGDSEDTTIHQEKWDRKLHVGPILLWSSGGWGENTPVLSIPNEWPKYMLIERPDVRNQNQNCLELSLALLKATHCSPWHPCDF